MKLAAGVDPFAVEARKQGGRGGAVEAAVVEAETYLYRSHSFCAHPERTSSSKRKPFKMAGPQKIVK